MRGVALALGGACYDNAAMRYALTALLMGWALPVWARYEDLFGDEEESYAGKFSTETQLLLYAIGVLGVWWWYLMSDTKSPMRWVVGLAIVSVPFAYFMLPELLAFYVFSPLLYYFVRSKVKR